MIKKLRATVLAAVLGVTGMTANAIPIVATFSGTVNYGSRCDINGCVSIVGESVSATVEFDTDSAPSNYYGSSSDYGFYQTTSGSWLNWTVEAGGESLIIASAPFDYFSEYMYVIDRSYGLDYVEAYSYGTFDDYDSQTGTTTQGYRYLDMYVYDYVKDFVSGTGLLQFDSIDAPYYGYGSFYSYLYEYNSQGVYSQYGYNYGNFSIDSLTVGERVAVAEPGTLALMWLGLSAIGASVYGRRRSARGRAND